MGTAPPGAAALLAPSDTALGVLTQGTTAPLHVACALVDARVPRGVRSGELLEVCGDAGVGKSELLLHTIAALVLPRTYGGCDVGGKEQRVHVIDAEGKLCVRRLVELIEFAVRARPACADAPFLRRAADLDAFVHACLERVVVFRPASPLQLLATLRALADECTSSGGVRVLCVDNMAAYHWAARAEDVQGHVWHGVVSTLRALLHTHKVAVLATKAMLYRDKKQKQEFLGNEWRALVTWRLTLTKHNGHGLGRLESRSDTAAPVPFVLTREGIVLCDEAPPMN